MKQSKTAVQSGLRGAKAALKYIIVSLSAVLTAVILSVLFSGNGCFRRRSRSEQGGGFVSGAEARLSVSVPVEGDLSYLRRRIQRFRRKKSEDRCL